TRSTPASVPSEPLVRQAVLGLDAGTGSLKGGLYTPGGEPLGLATETYPLATPEPGAMEQDPAHWWTALAAVSRQLLDRAGPVQLLAVAISGQAPTLVAVDADLLPTIPRSRGSTGARPRKPSGCTPDSGNRCQPGD